jgi:hypothetical protein
MHSQKTATTSCDESLLTAMLHQAGLNFRPRSTSLRLDLPFGQMLIECFNNAMVKELAKTFQHYLSDTPTADLRCSLEVQVIDEQTWYKLKPLITSTHSSEQAEYFRWVDGEGVIIHGLFAVFIPFAPATNILILAAKHRFMCQQTRAENFSMFSTDPEYFTDWLVISDLVKGLYAYRTQAYCLHAAMLEINGKGVLIVGESGAGKTTAALSLARAGFTLMSDDLIFIQIDNNNKAKATGLLMSPNFVGNSPVLLQDLEQTLEQGGIEKTSADLAQFQISTSSKRSVTPEVLILLEKPAKRSNQHQLLEVENQTALGAIMSQIVDPMTVPRRLEHINLASLLIDQCRISKLITGRNLTSLAGLVESELEQASCQ